MLAFEALPRATMVVGLQDASLHMTPVLKDPMIQNQLPLDKGTVLNFSPHSHSTSNDSMPPRARSFQECISQSIIRIRAFESFCSSLSITLLRSKDVFELAHIKSQRGFIEQ